MPTCVVVGAQWGDEGKGKVVDLFAEECDFIVRYQGGNNAGHTLVVDRGNGPEKTVLHLLPSGILHPDKVCVIARGVVIDCDVLFRELDALAARGIGVAPAWAWRRLGRGVGVASTRRSRGVAVALALSSAWCGVRVGVASA
jgi:adenylosuccinate synthase